VCTFSVLQHGQLKFHHSLLSLGYRVVVESLHFRELDAIFVIIGGFLLGRVGLRGGCRYVGG